MGRRYKLVRQNDQADCGPAALATLARHHGLTVGLEQLRDLSHTGRNGANLQGLRHAAERLGFSAKAVRCSVETLAQLPLPAVAHVTEEGGIGHFVVIFELRGAKIVIGDPARGVVTLPMAEFEQKWSGALLLAMPDLTSRAVIESRSLPPWHRFLQLLRPHTGILGEVVLCALLMTALAISTSYFVQHLVDSVLVHYERTLLNALAIGMVLIVVLRTVFGAVRQYLLAFLSRRIDLMLMGTYARHVLQLPANFFETRRVGEIFARVRDADKLRDAISGATTTAIVDGIVVSLVLTMLWFYDLPLAAATTLVAPLFLLAVALNHSSIARHSHASMERGSVFAAHLVEDIAGAETIKVFEAQDHRSDRTEARLVDFIQSMFCLQKLDVRMSSLSMLLTGLTGVGILWLGGHRVLSGALTIGQLLFFYTLLTTLLEPLNRLAMVNLKIHDALTAIDRLFQILDLPVEPRGDNKAPFIGPQRDIEFRNVTFNYGTRGNVLNDVCLRLPAGKSVAIVGESGSGKSTLIKLLLRFHLPNEGQILVDGTDIRDFELSSLRSRLGVVTQDAFVFNGTIRENISLGAPGAALADVISAARAAGMDEFIAGLPDRYETIVGERGANLSGGQRQRLAIARALVSNPDVLIFDEATSQLDTTTERLIQENLRATLAGRTALLVAHRLSTIKDVDLIYVLHEGSVVEQGSHRQLLAAGGRYASLWRSQSANNEIENLVATTESGRILTNRISNAL